jgi:hypothetical protein
MELISMELGAAFAGVKTKDEVINERVSIEMASRGPENTRANNLRTYFYRSLQELSKAPARLARVMVL